MRKVVIIVDLLNVFLTKALLKAGYFDGINKDGKMECEFRLGVQGEYSTFLPQEVVFEKSQLYMTDFTETIIDDIQYDIDERVNQARLNFNLDDSDIVEVVFAYDSVSDEFRKELYPLYKSHRKGSYVKSLIWGLYKHVLKDVISYISSRYEIKYKEQYEADDIILSLVHYYSTCNKKELLPAVDKDYLPTINDETIEEIEDIQLNDDTYKKIIRYKNYIVSNNTYDVTEITEIIYEDEVQKSTIRYIEFIGDREYEGTYVITDDKDAYITLDEDNVVIFKVTQAQIDIENNVLTYMDRESLLITTGLTPTEYEVFMILNGDTSDTVPALLDEVVSRDMAVLFGTKSNLEVAYKELKEFYENGYDLNVMGYNTDLLFRKIEDRNIAIDGMIEENKYLPYEEQYTNLDKFTIDTFSRNIKLISLVSFPMSEISNYDPEIHGER